MNDSTMVCGFLYIDWNTGRPIWAELSPVTDFGESCCRQFEMSECNRGGLCNFMVFFELRLFDPFSMSKK